MSERLVAAAARDRLAETLPQLVLPELHLQTERVIDHALDQVGVLAAFVEPVAHTTEGGDHVGPHRVHHVIAVTLHDGHQRLHPVQERSLFLGCEQIDRVALLFRRGSRHELARGNHHATGEALRVHLDRLEVRPHEIEEGIAQPRDARELEPVRNLVHRDPQREVLRDEAHALARLDHVRANEVEGCPAPRTARPLPLGEARIRFRNQ